MPELSAASHDASPLPIRLDGPWRRVAAWLDMLVADVGLWRLLSPNRHRVAAGLWRSAQPTPGQIARLARRHGLRTVVSLRGTRVRPGTLALELDVCRRLGLRFVDLPMDSRDPPQPAVLERFAALLDEAPEPMLVHCKAGSDRVGLFAALYLILREERSAAEAGRQLSVRYGHVRQAKSGVLDYFLARYGEAAAAAPVAFMDWAARDYDRAAMRAEFRSSWWANVLMDRALRRE